MSLNLDSKEPIVKPSRLTLGYDTLISRIMLYLELQFKREQIQSLIS